MALTTTLPTQDQVQQKFDAAANAGVSPCLWIPPEWDELTKENGKGVLDDTCADPGPFDNNNAAIVRVENGKKIGPPESPESAPNDRNWPHPFADTSHIDEPEFTNEDLNHVVAALQARHPDALERLKRIVGPDSPGMQRLTRIFDWALYRTTELLGDINTALGNEQQYRAARDNYINFLTDLDDHEPESHDRKLDVSNKKFPSGYGRAMKWTCIDPVIFRGEIYGVRVVIKWNPHSSSNGIPIKHT